jgi:hypothetical protein
MGDSLPDPNGFPRPWLLRKRPGLRLRGLQGERRAAPRANDFFESEVVGRIDRVLALRAKEVHGQNSRVGRNAKLRFRRDILALLSGASKTKGPKWGFPRQAALFAELTRTKRDVRGIWILGDPETTPAFETAGVEADEETRRARALEGQLVG